MQTIEGRSMLRGDRAMTGGHHYSLFKDKEMKLREAPTNQKLPRVLKLIMSGSN